VASDFQCKQCGIDIDSAADHNRPCPLPRYSTGNHWLSDDDTRLLLSRVAWAERAAQGLTRPSGKVSQ
jgi:hypothetical protein